MPVLLAHLASNGRDRHAIPERVLPPTQRLDLTEGIHENKEKKDNHECTSRQDSAWVGGRVITFHTPPPVPPQADQSAEGEVVRPLVRACGGRVRWGVLGPEGPGK
jgi:hypothetical protein